MSAKGCLLRSERCIVLLAAFLLVQTGVWHGGLILKNSTGGKDLFSTMVMAVGGDGSIWAQLKPIVSATCHRHFILLIACQWMCGRK